MHLRYLLGGLLAVGALGVVACGSGVISGDSGQGGTDGGPTQDATIDGSDADQMPSRDSGAGGPNGEGETDGSAEDTGADGLTGEAGADALTGDAAADAFCSPLPGVPAPTPGVVACEGMTCALEGGVVCCIDYVRSGVGQCMQASLCPPSQVKNCDESADCAGSACCITYGAGTQTTRETINACASSCPGNFTGDEACEGDAGCGPGQTCRTYLVNGYTVSTCAPPDARCPQ